MLVILGSAVPGPSIPDPHPCGEGEKRGTESHHSMSRARDQHPAASRDQQHSTWAAPATSPALAHRAQPPHAAPSTSQPRHKPFYCCSGPSRPSLYTRQAPKDLSTSSTRAARMGEGLKESGSGAGSAFCPLVTGLWESAAGSQVSAVGQETLSKAERCRELPCSTRQPSHEGRGEKKSLLPLRRGSSRSSCTFWTRVLNPSNRRPDLFGASVLLVPGSCFTPAFPETSSQQRHRGFCSADLPRAKPHEPESRRRAAQWAGRAGGQADGRLPAAARTGRKMLRRQESASPSKDSPRSRSEGMHFSTGS